MKKFVLIAVMGLITLASHAQTTPQKIGYVNVDYIFTQMPEFKQIEAEMKSTETALRNQIQTKATEFQKKLADYNQNINNMLDAVRVNTERELKQLQDNLERLQQDAQTSIQNKQTQLMEPVYQKVGKAIEETAKENAFNLVLNEQIGGLDVVLFADDATNISDLVLKKMGITPKPEAANAPATTTPSTATQTPAQSTPKTTTKPASK